MVVKASVYGFPRPHHKVTGVERRILKFGHSHRAVYNLERKQAVNEAAEIA